MRCGATAGCQRYQSYEGCKDHGRAAAADGGRHAGRQFAVPHRGAGTSLPPAGASGTGSGLVGCDCPAQLAGSTFSSSTRGTPLGPGKSANALFTMAGITVASVGVWPWLLTVT